MKLPVSSIRARFLFMGSVLLALVIPAVLYTNHHVREAASQSNDLISIHRSIGNVLRDFKDSIQAIERTVYQYSLELDEPTQNEVLRHLQNARALAQQIVSDRALRSHLNLNEPAQNLLIALSELDTEVSFFLRMLGSAETRFSAGPIMLHELFPTNTEFSQAVDLAIVEAEERKAEPSQAAILDVLHELRYTWAQQVSSTRLFAANRSGIFGEAERSMAQTQSNRDIYSARIRELLEMLTRFRDQKRLGFQQQVSLELMRAAYTRYEEAFNRAADLYNSDNWRVDLPLLRNRIGPVMERALSLVGVMEREMDRLAQESLLQSIATSSFLSSVIWLFSGTVGVLLLFSYVVFEFMVRRPILEVSTALDAEGKGFSYDLSPMHYTSETLALVGAFRRMQEQVRSRQIRLQSIFDNVAEGIITLDESGVIESYNSAARAVFGYAAPEAVGKNAAVLIRFHGQDDCANLLEYCLSTKPQSHGVESTVIARRRDGAQFPMSLKVSEMFVDGRRLFVALVADISERVAMLENLKQMAEHDALTGLYNRQYFMYELERTVERVRRGQVADYGLLFIDLDNFKYVNDTLGHAAGDQVLAEVSQMLLRRNRRTDLLARLGGDEFAILLSGVSHDQIILAAESHVKLLADFPFKYDGKVVNMGCSVGVAMFGADVQNKEELLARSDIACQVAKRSGRNRIHIYQPADEKAMTAMSEHMGWATRIKHAVEMDKLVLASQAIMSLKDRTINRYEILLRMVDDDGRLILPAGFLPAAERFGLMQSLDRWVIDRSISMLGRWRESDPKVCFSVNLSPNSVGDPSILDAITGALERYQVAPEALIFEITETAAIANLSSAQHFLAALQMLGCKTALDDFGVGYSSFAYLKDLPADYVKIDGAFVKDIHTDPLHLAMVRSMSDIAHAMGKLTVAEYVNDEACLELLQKIGVDYVQGYLVGKPTILEFYHDANDTKVPRSAARQ